MNIKKSHWILVVIDLKRHAFVYYDSLPTYSTEKEIAAIIGPLRNCVPHLLYNVGLSESVDQWPVRRIRNTPIQDNDKDCGVYIIKFFECLVTGNRVDILTPSLCKQFRLMLSAEVWSNTPVF